MSHPAELGTRNLERAHMSNLALRLTTAAIGLPIVIAVAWIGGWPFAIAAGVILFLAAVEFHHGWLIPSMPLREARQFVPPAAACGAIAVFAYNSLSSLWLGIALAAVLAAAGYSHTNLFGPRRPFRVMSWALLYIGVLGAALVLVRELGFGRDWFFILLLATFATDTGAYITGRLIGRHKLAPKISPKKTIEGAVGGFAWGVAAVIALEAIFETPATTAEVIPLAILLPIAAQAGDLFESWMKRRMGVKDASGLLPGHGGFMDRLDSILAVMPIAWLYLDFWVQR